MRSEIYVRNSHHKHEPIKTPITNVTATASPPPILWLIPEKAMKKEKAERGLVMVRTKADKDSSMNPIFL